MKKKNTCPDWCKLKYLFDIPPIWILPPQKPDTFTGVMISRDPTTRFIPYYKDVKERSPSSQRPYLFKSAIPQWIYDRITYFNQKCNDNAINEQSLEIFRKTLFTEIYWTHLHKCCTDKRGKELLKFAKKNAYCCADQWLRKEIEYASKEDISFIITLGKDVERWFERNRSELNLPSTIRIYYLPHPSGANMAEWCPKDEQKRIRLKEKITDLVTNCQ